jgi:CheY-like chemotaxis protein
MPQGLAAMREHRFLAVLTDTHMPIMGGYEQVI